MTPQIARLDVADARRADAETARRADVESANAVAKIRQERARREQQFERWDALLASDQFGEYLYRRDLAIENVYVPPPRAVEAEGCAIGAMMMDARAVEIGLGPLRPEMFGDRFLQNALKAVAAVKRRNELEPGRAVLIDTVSVTYEMRRRKTFIPDTFTLLTSCCQDCPSSANMAAYVGAIVTASKQNYLLRLGRYLADLAQGKDEKFPHLEPALLASCTRRALDEIEAKGYADLNAIFNPTK